MKHSDISRILEVAEVAARSAGRRAMEEMKYVKGTLKNGNEMVTQADKICQDIIIEQIKQYYPDHGIIGEEGSEGKIFKQTPRGSDDLWWIIDPIDGTNNYACGILSFTVSVGVLFEGSPIAGAIFDPATDSMYTACRDTEARLNGSRIQCGDADISPYTSVGIDNHLPDDLFAGTYEIMKRCRFRNFGTTALHCAFVASGAFVGTITTVPRIWDIAAGAIIIDRAGGLMTDLDGNSIFPLELTGYEGESFRIAAGNKKVQPEIIEILKKQ